MFLVYPYPLIQRDLAAVPCPIALLCADTCRHERATCRVALIATAADCFAELGLGADLAVARIEVVAQVIDDEAAAFVADLPALVRRLAAHLVLDGVELRSTVCTKSVALDIDVHNEAWCLCHPGQGCPMNKRYFFGAIGLAALAVPALSSETVTYTYDAQGRLTKVVHTGTVNNNLQANYSFDKADNRINMNVTGSPNPPP